MSSLTVYAPQITILDKAINMIDGLYSLNDMHKASGGDKKHRPTFFLRNQETKDLIIELNEEITDVRKCTSADFKAVQVVKGGNDRSKQGTYACKEIIYRYAMWISPKFALLVIRTFDKLVTGELKVVSKQLTATQTLPLRNAVNKLVSASGIMYPDGYKMVHREFGVSEIKDLTLEQLSQAIEYIHNKTPSVAVAKTPLSDFTHSQYITNVKSEVMDYVYSLQKVIVANGINLPAYPNFDKEEICQSFIASMVRHNRMMLSFDYQGLPAIKFIPEEHAIVSRENIADVVNFADKNQLPSIINKAVERLGK